MLTPAERVKPVLVFTKHTEKMKYISRRKHHRGEGAK
jgi:hypothetical protein